MANLGGGILDNSRYYTYLKALRAGTIVPTAKLEFLDQNGVPSFDVGSDFFSGGQLSVNFQNGMRRTATVTLNNWDEIYSINVNKTWIGQQVRLLAGIVLPDGTDYLIQQGVFYISNPEEVYSPAEHTVRLNLVDKWGALDGTVGGTLDGIYQINPGDDLCVALQQLLLLDRGNGIPIDNVAPVIDSYYKDKTCVLADGTTIVPFTQAPHTSRTEADKTYADVVLDINTMLVATVGYDSAGQLRIETANTDTKDNLRPVVWDFSVNEREFYSGTFSHKMSEMYNDVVVSGALIDGVNIRGRATNNNPMSPCSVNRTRRQTYYVDDTNLSTYEQCNDLAKYWLRKLTSVQKEASFTTTPIYHLRENNLVTLLRNEISNIPEKYLVTGFSLPLGGTGVMTINAVAISDIDIYDKWLRNHTLSVFCSEIQELICWYIQDGITTQTELTNPYDIEEIPSGLLVTFAVSNIIEKGARVSTSAYSSQSLATEAIYNDSTGEYALTMPADWSYTPGNEIAFTVPPGAALSTNTYSAQPMATSAIYDSATGKYTLVMPTDWEYVQGGEIAFVVPAVIGSATTISIVIGDKSWVFATRPTTLAANATAVVILNDIKDSATLQSIVIGNTKWDFKITPTLTVNTKAVIVLKDIDKRYTILSATLNNISLAHDGKSCSFYMPDHDSDLRFVLSAVNGNDITYEYTGTCTEVVDMNAVVSTTAYSDQPIATEATYDDDNGEYTLTMPDGWEYASGNEIAFVVPEIPEDASEISVIIGEREWFFAEVPTLIATETIVVSLSNTSYSTMNGLKYKCLKLSTSGFFKFTIDPLELDENLHDTSTDIASSYINISGTIASSTAYKLTDYIPVSYGNVYKISGYYSTAYTAAAAIAYYDATKTLLAAEPCSAVGTATILPHVPEMASYARFSMTNADAATFVMYVSDGDKLITGDLWARGAGGAGNAKVEGSNGYDKKVYDGEITSATVTIGTAGATKTNKGGQGKGTSFGTLITSPGGSGASGASSGSGGSLTKIFGCIKDRKSGKGGAINTAGSDGVVYIRIAI